MTSVFGILNRLLPFATPGTPVLQDVIHLTAICALLYFAPQIQERIQASRALAAETGDEAGEGRPERQATGGEAHQGNAHDNAVRMNEMVAPETGQQPIGDANHEHDDDPPEVNDHIEEGQAGPARAPFIPERRNVGAKKAKALARRDQQRAYHEFQRSQGDAQRARDAEGAAEREKVQAAERDRRKAAEAALEAKKAKEREERRVKEEADRLEEQRRRERAVELVRSRLEADRACDLFKVAKEVGVDDEEWVERILRSSGVVGRRNDTVTMITGMGWAVRVSAADMQRVYDDILEDELASDEDGRIDPVYVASVLETSIRTAR